MKNCYNCGLSKKDKDVLEDRICSVYGKINDIKCNEGCMWWERKAKKIKKKEFKMKIVLINIILTKEQKEDFAQNYNLDEVNPFVSVIHEASPSLKAVDVPQASETIISKILEVFEGKSIGFYDSSFVIINHSDICILYYVTALCHKFGIRVLDSKFREFTKPLGGLK